MNIPLQTYNKKKNLFRYLLKETLETKVVLNFFLKKKNFIFRKTIYELKNFILK